MTNTTAVARADVAATRDIGEFAAGLSADALLGVRVLLVNMPLRESAPPNCAPLGPALLAARLRQYGADVSIVDINAYRVEDADHPGRKRGLNFDEAAGLLFRHVDRNGEPWLIGLSGMITTLRWQKWVAETLRRMCPAAMLVSGGGLATEFREGLFRWIPQLDAVAHSEGDDVILKMTADARVLRERGVAHLVASGQLGEHLLAADVGGARLRLMYGGGRPLDLDALPLPAWDLLAKDVNGGSPLETYIGNEIWGLAANNSSATPWRMTRSLNTVSSRGCPFSCRYCFRGAQGEREYNVRGVSSIVDEVRWMSDKWNIDACAFLDDNFLVRKDRILALAGPLGDLCKERDIKWGTHGRLDEAADADRMRGLAKSGCVYVGFGAESASPNALTLMGKGGQMLARGTERVDGVDLPKTMLDGYRRTVENGIHGNCTWILSYPGTTIFDEKKSSVFIEWQKRVLGNDAGVNGHAFVAQAYPGTEMFTNPRVQQRLRDGFGLSFGKFGQPVVDDALLAYSLSLDDATTVLIDLHGRPVFYGDTTEDEFLRMKALADDGRTAEILNL